MAAATTPSIQSIGTPLGYRLHADCPRPVLDGESGARYRTIARALQGMQKEAVVHAAGARAAWRMVCDEGPYLNGTDLAPFPLAFYTAGLVDSYASTILREARTRGLRIESLAITQDNRYTMEGSALRGTMKGGALPVELDIDIGTQGDHDEIPALVRAAIPATPGDAVARLSLPSVFAAALNGSPLPLPQLRHSPHRLAPDPGDEFDCIRPADAAEFEADAITKLQSAETVFGVEGGAGSSLLAEQKRTLHVRGILNVRPDGIRQTRIQLFKPLGSQFQFLSEDPENEGGSGRAPDGLSLLSAGIAFCFLTQLSRYAHIVKQKLEGCRLVQESCFRAGSPGTGEARSRAEPVATHVFVDSPEPGQAIQQMIAMGEQTCFLHANLRGTNAARVAVRVNGTPAI
jgi:organic hydroperoxide reductase OsmC/OhrA